MSIIQWNCRGTHSSSEQLKTISRDADAKKICLQETKLGDRQYNPGLNYNFYKSAPLPGERSQGELALLSINQLSILKSFLIQFFKLALFKYN